MIDIVCRYGNVTAFTNRLKSLGIIVRNPVDDGGNKVNPYKLIEQLNSPVMEDINADFFVSIRMSADQADKIPPDNNPAFSILWRSDDVDGEGVQQPWPEAEVTAYDIDGLPDGTRMQGVGQLA